LILFPPRKVGEGRFVSRQRMFTVREALMISHRDRSLAWQCGPLAPCLRVVWALFFCLSLCSCASTTLNVIEGERLVEHGPLAGIELTRAGVRQEPRPNLALQPGDQIRTGPQSIAVLTFADGDRVFVLPASEVRIGSIFVSIGAVLVRVKGFFQVETRYATAGSEGTEYLVRVDPGDRVRVVVAEGRVGLASRQEAWAKTVLRVGQGAWIIGAKPPVAAPVSAAEIGQIRQRIRELDALVPQRSDFGPLLGGVMAIGVSLGVHHFTRDKADDPPRSDPPPVGGSRAPPPVRQIPPSDLTPELTPRRPAGLQSDDRLR
jgi:hypothetical protein